MQLHNIKEKKLLSLLRQTINKNKTVEGEVSELEYDIVCYLFYVVPHGSAAGVRWGFPAQNNIGPVCF